MENLLALSCGSIGQCFFGGNNPLLGTASQPLGGIASLVSLFLKIAFVLSGFVLLLFFIIGGIGLMAGAGGNNPERAEQSKKTVTSAVIGFIVVFASYWIVKLIGQLIGMPNLI